MNAAAQVTTTVVAGDMVWGRPVVEGKTLARRKGIVLGTLSGKADDTNIIVWWFSKGAADVSTTTMMFVSELTKDGDIFNLHGHRALKLARNTYYFSRAHNVGRMLEHHGRRMRSIGC